MLEKIRELRQIEGTLFKERCEHVLFLGTFNANSHLERIRNWLPRQFSENGIEHLVIADNDSPQESWNLLLDLSQELKEGGWNVLLVRNPINLGGWGSLAANLDLLENFDWVTTFHQDDQYASDHAVRHRQVARSSPSNVAMIASEAVSMDSKGRVMGYPRASWLLPKKQEAHETFSSLVRFHYLPFSGATFRVEFFAESKAPWFSTAFPDTELLLEGLPKWVYLVLEEPKVSYTENQVSESHGLSLRQREFGAASALLRIFDGPGFVELTKELSDEQFETFCRSMLTSIRARLTLDDLFILTFSHMLDASARIRLEAGLTTPISPMADLFRLTNDDFGEELCRNLNSLRQTSISKAIEDENPPEKAETNPPRDHQRVRIFLLLILGKLSQRTLRSLWVTLLRSKFGRRRWPNWDF